VTWIDDATELVRDFDRSRPRSTQTAIGWSEAGGCRSAIAFRLDGAFAEETDTWAAQRGTAVHDYVLPLLAKSMPGGRCEVPTEYRGIPGTADLVDWASVTDAKTTTLANSKLWANDFGLIRPKRIQAHGYAAGLVDAGELEPDCTVRILVIPVDGTFGDWWAYEEPFDRALADEGVDRIEWVRGRMASGLPWPKDKQYAFCQTWCGFFALCRKDDDPDALEDITDPETVAAIEAYGDAVARYSAAEKDKERLASLIRGLRGKTASGWRVTLGKPGAGSLVLDEEQVRADYAELGRGVPEVFKEGQAGRLSVTRIKKPKPGEGGGDG
jgi:hypothetical protein